MTFEAALRTELVAIDGLLNKVFPMTAPEGTAAPYIIYTSTLGNYDKTLTGWTRSKAVSVEINVIHNHPTLMRALAKEVQAKIMGFLGRVLAEAGPKIDDLVLESDAPELYEAQVGLYRKVISFTAFFEEE